MEPEVAEELMADGDLKPIVEDVQSAHSSLPDNRLLTPEGSCFDAKKSAGLNLISQFLSSQESSDESDSTTSSDEPVILSDVELSELNYKLPNTCPKVKGEIDYRELPSEDNCSVPFPVEGKILPIGEVVHYTEKLVVIKSLPNTPTINEGTILWRDDKTSIAKVFETFGPVKTPFYSILVHSLDHVNQLGLKPGETVYVVPGDLDLTSYVFTTKLLAQKGCDASWKNDQETPVEYQEFSDDDQELFVRKKTKRKGVQRNDVQEQDTNCIEYPSSDIHLPSSIPPVQLSQLPELHPLLYPPGVYHRIPFNPPFLPYAGPPPSLYPPPWPGYPPPFH